MLALAGMLAWLAWKENQPVGMCIIRVVAEESELITLCVLEEYRSQGMGHDLLEAAMVRAVEEGARKMFLEVAEHNESALNLYKAVGFERIGRRKAYYTQLYEAPADALTLCADLAKDESR